MTDEEEDWFSGNGYGHGAGATEVRRLLVQLERIKPLLGRLGLHIVGSTERAVLDAIPAWLKSRNLADGGRAEWALYEAADLLARRVAKEGA